MHEAECVDLLQDGAQLYKHRSGAKRGHGLRPVHELGEVESVDAFHDEVGAPEMFAEIKKSYDTADFVE
ncbi:hypothetical protein BBK82_26615 [Lentzea guizhouensis]|uniref:Uncharacterized protein n=1 Tax=Lentzea guizhouensis TaxID=1586287 RepID=A0A1B2HN12_9PSEU|nr:hypothetical protein BBK82_26615 [Lentzea guizhouensis]